MSNAERGDAVLLPEGMPAPLPAATRYQILALHGGGFRGLFTARVLERLETAGLSPTRSVDLYAGTSIGSILAGALALGRSPRSLREAMLEHGPTIFPARRWHQRLTPAPLRGLVHAPYRAEPLAAAIRAILGEEAERPLSEVSTPLVIPCVSHTRAGVRLLRSAGLGAATADPIAIGEAMLASAAAPTWFPPRRLGGQTLIDGGVVANAPEIVALCEAVRLGQPLERLHVLGIGTASVSEAGPPLTADEDRGHGRLPWLLARAIVNVALAAQEDLATAQCRTLLGSERYLLLDKAPSVREAARLGLDRADAAARDTLMSLADACVDEALDGELGRRLRRFSDHVAELPPNETRR